MQGGDILSVLIASVICLHFGMQKKDNLKQTNGKMSFVYTLVNLKTIV